MQHIDDLGKLERMKREGALFVLFGGDHCSVCKSLRPRLSSTITERFPKMRRVYIDCERSPEICAQHSIFTLPAVQVYIEGMLVAEDARAFGLTELIERIERPYTLWRGQKQQANS